MEQEILNKVKGMFDTPEKWFSYLELIKLKGNLVSSMHKHLREGMDKYFHENSFTGYRFQFDDFVTSNAYWYLEEVGRGIRLYFRDGNMAFYVDENIYQNTEELNNLLQKTENAIILHALFRHDKYGDKWWKIVEKGNWQFKKDSEYDGAFDYDGLAWYAENEIESFLQQIHFKVEKFCTNEQIKKIIVDIDSIAKQGVG